MTKTNFWIRSWKTILMFLVLSMVWQAHAQATGTPYTKMAPVDQYRMERNAEIALARSAAPDSISRDADVYVMGQRAYEIASKGNNGFACLVLRGWTAASDDPVFWNPRIRGPACFNAPAVRSYLPFVFKRTDLVLAAMPKDQILEGLKSGFAKKELPPIEVGSMCYMMSPNGYLSDDGGRWRPHLMFFLPQTPDAAWGAGLPGAPIIASQDPEDHLTVFIVPVGKWSDGVADHKDDHAAGENHQH